MKNFKINPKKTAEKLIDFISRTVKAKGFEKVVIGLSGGLDSSTVASLAKRALGKENVIAAVMPYGRLSQSDEKDAKKLAKTLKLKTEYIDISHMVDAYFSKVKDADNIRRGNKMARERMSILYDLSRKYDALVIGTSNKTERLLGYGTLYGDTACALNPIGGLYKTQLKLVAKYLSLPAYIINKAPSAGLWHGQTDEDELGYRYKDMDRLLFFMVDKKLKDKQLIRKGFNRKFISDIRKKIRINRFKCRPPAIARI